MRRNNGGENSKRAMLWGGSLCVNKDAILMGNVLDADAIATTGPENLFQLFGEWLQRAAQARFRHENGRL